MKNTLISLTPAGAEGDGYAVRPAGEGWGLAPLTREGWDG